MRSSALALLFVAIVPFCASAQTPTAGARVQAPTPGVLVTPPVAVAVAPPPEPVSTEPPRNVRFEIVISDGGIPRPTSKKVSMIVATGREGQVRSTAQEAQGNAAFTRGVPLNVDVVRPSILPNGGILAAIVIEYQPMSPGTVAVPAMVRARLNAILPNGRKTLISETADPTSDRTTTLEVTATVLP